MFRTADTANLALAESNVNLEVGCDEKECSKLQGLIVDISQ